MAFLMTIVTSMMIVVVMMMLSYPVEGFVHPITITSYRAILPGSHHHHYHHPRVFPSKTPSILSKPSTFDSRASSSSSSSLYTRKQQNDDRSQDNNDLLDVIVERWNHANGLEIRLDATLAACHVLAQFLVYDMSLPRKDIPGFEIVDIIMLVNLFSSVVVLVIFWTLFGLATRIFEEVEVETTNNENVDLQLFTRLVVTSLLAGPSWLAVNTIFQWSPFGIVMDASSSVDNSVVATIAAACIGLCIVMSIGRVVSSNVL